MNKKLLYIVIGIILLIVLSVVYLLSIKRSPLVAPPVTMQQETITSSSTPPTAKPGAYQPYTEQAVALAEADVTKILFFHAPWCPQCRELEASIKTGPLPNNVLIFKVDYDSNQALRQKYGVTLQTTLVKIDNAGGLLKKFIAYDNPSLQALKDNLLP